MEERYFQHFKGGIYKYIGEAKDSETQDDLIIYQAMYGERKMWARPKGMFFEWIQLDDGRRVPRFRELLYGKAMRLIEKKDEPMSNSKIVMELKEIASASDDKLVYRMIVDLINQIKENGKRT